MRFFGPLYDRVLGWAGHHYAERYLAALSFAESSFFPIPPDVMLVPMCLADRPRAWRFAAITSVMSLLGGIAGYFIGYFLIESIEPWLQNAGYWTDFVGARDWFSTWGVWAVFVAGFSPIPYKIFAVAAGATMLTLAGFIVASLVGRSARFFLVAGLIVAGGERMEETLKRYVERIGWGVVLAAIAVAGIILYRQ